MYLIKLFLSSANLLLDVVVDQIGNISHQQTDVRQLQRFKLLRQSQVPLQIVLLEEVDAEGDL